MLGAHRWRAGLARVWRSSLASNKLDNAQSRWLASTPTDGALDGPAASSSSDGRGDGDARRQQPSPVQSGVHRTSGSAPPGSGPASSSHPPPGDWRGSADGVLPASAALAEVLAQTRGITEADLAKELGNPTSGAGDKEGPPADEDDYRLLAEAIDLYLATAPSLDENVDGINAVDRALMEGIAATIREDLGPSVTTGVGPDGSPLPPPHEPRVLNIAPPGRLPWECLAVDEDNATVHWAVDLTEGIAPDPWRNARLSDESKALMHKMHKKDPKGDGAVEALAQRFRIRQQRVMAILALQEMEESAAKNKEPLLEEVAQVMADVHSCNEATGAGEAHLVSVPSFPAYKEVDPAAAIQALEALLGRPSHEISEDDITPEIAREVLGVKSQDELEEDLAASEEAAAVAEFRQRLDFNVGKVGQAVSRESRRHKAAPRPAEGWSLVVTPLGRDQSGAQQQAPYVVSPDGEQRALNSDEALLHRRKTPLPRRKAL